MLTSRSTSGPDAFVDSLVATADEREVGRAGELARERVGQPLTGGIQEDDLGARGAKRLDRREERLGAHDHPRAAAVRLVVDRSVPPEAVLAQVVDPERRRCRPPRRGR